MYYVFMYSVFFFVFYNKLVYFNLIWFYDLIVQDIFPYFDLAILRLYFYHSLYFEIVLGRLLYSVSLIICVNQNCVTKDISCKLFMLLMSEISFTYTAHIGH